MVQLCSFWNVNGVSEWVRVYKSLIFSAELFFLLSSFILWLLFCRKEKRVEENSYGKSKCWDYWICCRRRSFPKKFHLDPHSVSFAICYHIHSSNEYSINQITRNLRLGWMASLGKWKSFRRQWKYSPSFPLYTLFLLLPLLAAENELGSGDYFVRSKNDDEEGRKRDSKAFLMNGSFFCWVKLFFLLDA